MNAPLRIFLYLLLGIFLFATASIVIRDGSQIMAGVAQYIVSLFVSADLNPRNSRGFNSFIQLVVIAWFIGWTIYRFKNMKK